ncbi:MAG: DNA excision repair protein ERCC-6, variant 2 [Marteilia pararefringens]
MVNVWYNLQNVIIITTYGHLRIHSEIFTSKKLYYVILDEGSVIRNNSRKISVIAKSLKTNHRIISSGTPIQNNLSELWSLMDFINPGLLGDLSDFNTNFSVPISNGSYKNCTYEQIACAYNSACILRDIIKPFILRRVKFDVIDEIELPDKKEKVIYVIPTNAQINLYKSFLNSKEFTLIIRKKIDPLSGIMKLRKICNHPIIFSNPSYFRRHGANETKDHHYSQIDLLDSGKFLVLKSLIDSWELAGEDADKILIFTQSIPMLDLVVYFLNSNNIGCLRIDGSVSLKDRSEFIKNFESVSTYSILVMSTRAGGIGINLTCANKIIILDPDWNPSIDNQAKERSWRIGQRRNVSIYRFITQGSIEEHIYKRQLLKQQVSNRILTNPKQARSLSNDFEIANIFSYDFNFKEVPEDDHAAAECKSSICRPIKTDRINMNIANKISKAMTNIDYNNEENSENKLPQIINKPDDFMPNFFSNLDCIKNKIDNIPIMDDVTIKKIADDIITKWKNEKNKGNPAGRMSFSSLLKQKIYSNEVSDLIVDENNEKIRQTTQELIKYMVKNKFIAYSHEIVEKFSTKFKNVSTLKAILKKVANFDKVKKVWIIKSELNN